MLFKLSLKPLTFSLNLPSLPLLLSFYLCLFILSSLLFPFSSIFLCLCLLFPFSLPLPPSLSLCPFSLSLPSFVSLSLISLPHSSTLPSISHRLHYTLTAPGFLQAILKRLSGASCVRLTTRSRLGPISSSSTRGNLLPDFLSKILHHNNT